MTLRRVVFVDSSVLLNVVDVPRKNGQRREVLLRLAELQRTDAGALLVLPLAAVIEVGNHIAQLDRRERGEPAGKFVGLLKAALLGTVPYVLSGSSWDPRFLGLLLDGPTPDRSMQAMAQRGIGTGDSSILLEVEHFRDRVDIGSATPLEVWTYDNELLALARGIGCA